GPGAARRDGHVRPGLALELTARPVRTPARLTNAEKRANVPDPGLGIRRCGPRRTLGDHGPQRALLRRRRERPEPHPRREPPHRPDAVRAVAQPLRAVIVHPPRRQGGHAGGRRRPTRHGARPQPTTVSGPISHDSLSGEDPMSTVTTKDGVEIYYKD